MSIALQGYCVEVLNDKGYKKYVEGFGHVLPLLEDLGVRQIEAGLSPGNMNIRLARPDSGIMGCKVDWIGIHFKTKGYPDCVYTVGLDNTIFDGSRFGPPKFGVDHSLASTRDERVNLTLSRPREGSDVLSALCFHIRQLKERVGMVVVRPLYGD